MNRRALLLSFAAAGLPVSGWRTAMAEDEPFVIKLFVTSTVSVLDSETCRFTEPQTITAIPSDGSDAIEIPVGDAGVQATITREGVSAQGCFFEIETSLPRSTSYSFEINGSELGFMNYVILTRMGSISLVWEEAYGEVDTSSTPIAYEAKTIGKWDVSVDLADVDDAPRDSIYEYRLLVTLNVTPRESGTHFVSRNVNLAVVTDTGAVIGEDRRATSKAQELLGQSLGVQKVDETRQYMFVFNIPQDWDIPWERETIEGWGINIEFRGQSVRLPLSISLPS